MVISSSSPTDPSIPINSSLTYIGSAYSMNVYEISYLNYTGYVIIPQGVYEGSFAGLLRLGNFVYVGVYKGITTRQTFTGYFIPMISYKAVKIPTELSSGNYSYFEAIVQSNIPVVLRYLVFNTYGNGTMINTLPLIAANKSGSRLTVWFSNAYDCREYRINVTLLSPTHIVPIPIIINLQPPIRYFVSNVTIINVSPRTELMLLEPGDIVYAETPITTANYTLYLCKKLSNQVNNYGMLYAMEYLAPIPALNSSVLGVFKVSKVGKPLMIVNDIFYRLASGEYKLAMYSVGPENLLLTGKGSIIDFVTLAMYVLRSYDVPTRVALGFYSTGSGKTHIITSSMSILWDESYVDGGWVMFTPVPLYGRSSMAIGYGNVGYQILLGLILALPWIIGYSIYLIISHVRPR
jgi:hypothetical protein